MLPLLLSNKPRFYGSLAASFLALVAAILIPRVTMEAIDNALIDQTTSLAPYIWALVGLALFRSILTYAYRTSLYGIAYRIEYDLRIIVYEHLTPHVVLVLRPRAVGPAHLPGQLRHPLGADVPDVRPARSLVMLRRASSSPSSSMLIDQRAAHARGDVDDARSSTWSACGCGSRCSRCRGSCRRASADVATIVDENINGVRVVKSFAAEDAADRRSWPAPRSGCSGRSVTDADIRAKYAPLHGEPAPPRAGRRAALRRLARHRRPGHGRRRSSPSTPTSCMLQAPFRMLGLILMLGQRAAASAQRIYEILDEPPDIVDRPGAVDLVDAPRRRRASTT